MTDKDNSTAASGDADTSGEDTAAAPAEGKTAADGGAPVRRRRTGLIVLVAVIVVVLVGIAAALTQEPVRARLAHLLTPGGAPRAVALATRLDALAAEVGKLRAGLAQVPDAARVAAIERRLDDLSKALKQQASGVAPARVAALESRLQTLDSRLQALGARVGTLAESSRAATTGPGPGVPVMLAFTGALDAGRPLTALAPALRDRLTALGSKGSGALSDLDALAPFLAGGVPTAAMLTARADALALMQAPATGAGQNAPSAAAAPSGNGGLWARIKARLAGLVTIRRVDEGAETTHAAARAHGGTPADAPLHAVRAALAAGDLAAARDSLAAVDAKGLTDAARDGLAALKRGIAARLAADRLAGALDGLVAAAATPSSSPATPVSTP